ncbi:hypothetical protein pdam_00023846 [Pocillopora damicornis]|uniref:Uncharacterized protein n=1 Tax=Pocillopora damicornis TaxID=46731 RepID=A0A3M6TWM7_POCDA|nr:hypothetical protein pdam_00023846 [Pocillopora damicornis]
MFSESKNVEQFYSALRAIPPMKEGSLYFSSIGHKIHSLWKSTGSSSSFIYDQTQPQDSPMLHVALDNQPSRSRDVAPVIVAPHFPSGLAVSLEERMQFNFNLFLYDSLRLPAGLFPDDQTGEVTFRHVEIIVHATYRVERNGAVDSSRSQTTHKKEEMNCLRRICF